MTTELYQNIAADVKIHMSSVIAEDHTVTFTPPPGLTINSGASLSFTPANAATDQNLNVTATTMGVKIIQYTVTSAYTQRTKTGTITCTVAEGAGAAIPTGSSIASITSYASGVGNGWTIATITIPSGSPFLGQWCRVECTNFTQSAPNTLMPLTVHYPITAPTSSDLLNAGSYSQFTFTEAGVYKIKVGITRSVSGDSLTGSFNFTFTHQNGSSQSLSASRCTCDQIAIAVQPSVPTGPFSLVAASGHTAPVGATIHDFATSFAISASFGVTSYTGTPSYTGGGSAAGTLTWTGTWVITTGSASLGTNPVTTPCYLQNTYDAAETVAFTAVGTACGLVIQAFA